MSEPRVTVTLDAAQEMVWEYALEHGWNQDPPDVMRQMMLIVTECAEAAEHWRKHRDDEIPAEFADILIRLLHYSALNGFNLNDLFLAKHEINTGRPFRHGGLRA